MLKRYTASSVVSNGDATYALDVNTIQMKAILTVPAGKECAIVTMDFQNVASTANVVVTVTRSGSVVSAMVFTLTAYDFITIDSKEFLEAGDVLAFGSSEEGVRCSVSCDVSDAE